MADRRTSEHAEPTSPTGKPTSFEDLPPPSTRRWVARRKAQVVAAVRGGVLSLEEACRRYRLSAEEFASWERLIDHHGLDGLRVTNLSKLRKQR
ncbi:MAG: DUF1153 domain-containing protein [Geminicoccaceae bacterium]|nr:DUF1153 domain-containing protein [Geminicoccaceae bacterium]MDW8125262.1 DUF1153 domain-containing protein [Geminicoccaceae bacterium]MDW8340486.1 DUF1153 domain-containing protein [Geminicoccaceae bacterium]